MGDYDGMGRALQFAVKAVVLLGSSVIGCLAALVLLALGYATAAMISGGLGLAIGVALAMWVRR